MTKFFPYFTGGLAVINFIIGIFQWNIAHANNKLLFVVAVTTSIFLSIISYAYWKQRNRTIPHLIHLKGLCAVTHELRDLVLRVPNGTLKNKDTWLIIKSLITSVVRLK
ncbi:MAG: hypothetical protein HZC52_04520 [Planctomycetes bacterium]|uniref:hypothetical protein n=1 Tax=Candidatus Wunengus sp. YC65 TaxID=3367701 RepID=UPI001DA3AA5B|nr:hypothetical protein [Planctomycetota bacterium]